MSLPNEIEYQGQMSQAIAKLFPEPIPEPFLQSSPLVKFVRVCEVCREPETKCLCLRRQ